MKDRPKTLTPKLRFPEFQEEWRESPLGTVVKEFQAKSTTQGEYEVLTSARVGLMRQVDYYGEGRITERDNVGFNVIPADYLTYRSRTDDGRFYFNHNDLGITGIVSVYYPVFHSTTGSNSFIAALLNRFSAEIGTHSVGTSQRVLPISKLLRVRLPIPVAAEQRKIAACLTSLDKRIAAEGKKLEALRAHKKGLMQQLFPREGETRPRLRFPEFRDAPEWGTEKLSTIFDLVSGVHLSPNEYGTEGEIPYFTGPSDFTNDANTVSKWTSASLNDAKQGDTLITVKGSGVGELMFLDLPLVAMGRQLMAARPKNDSGRFILYLLESKRMRFEDLASGNLIPGLSRGDILDLESPLPTDEAEQQQIASCLSSLDLLIAAQSRKLDGLRAHKKGLMQRLFPSPEGV